MNEKPKKRIEAKPRKVHTGDPVPRKVSNSLHDIAEVIQVEKLESGTIDWEQVKEAMKQRQCVRRLSWSEGKFMWYNPGRAKPVHSDAQEGTFHTPITHEFLKKNKVTKLIIGGHYNVWEKKANGDGIIHVGVLLSDSDKRATDWVIYQP